MVDSDWFMIIIDRWGQTIEYINEDFATWDGTNQDGFQCPAGVYFYAFHARVNGEYIKLIGTITVVR